MVYHIFTLLKATYVLPVKCLFMIFAHFSIGFYVFSFLIDILPLLVACVAYVWVYVGFLFWHFCLAYFYVKSIIWNKNKLDLDTFLSSHGNCLYYFCVVF